MSSLKALKKILSADMSEDSRKHKKKKPKKTKKTKMDKDLLRAKNDQWMKSYAQCCDMGIYTQCDEIKKKKRRKKTEVSLDEEFLLPLTQRKKPKLSKQHKQDTSSSYAFHTHKVEDVVQSSLGEQKEIQAVFGECFESSTQKDKVIHKKRVTFTLSPELIQPKSLQNPFAVRDSFISQPSRTDRPPSLITEDNSIYKPSVEENAVESQSTSEDINSQDLFITQKSLSDHYIEVCSNASTEDDQSYKPSSQDKPACRNKTEVSTQTQNFFTSPMLATSVRIRRQRTCTEEALDLSLTNRSRAYRPELKLTDLTSSDDSDVLAKSRSDLSQLKVVQTRLNESFFFKLKGEVESPKLRSPLMKLSGGVEKKK